MSNFTELTPKDLMHFFGWNSYEKARREAVAIRDTYKTKMLTVKHLADYLGFPESVVIAGLK